MLYVPLFYLLSVEAGTAGVCAVLVAAVVAEIRERLQRLVFEANCTTAHVVGSNVRHGPSRKLVLGCLSDSTWFSMCFRVRKEHVLEYFSFHKDDGQRMLERR